MKIQNAVCYSFYLSEEGTCAYLRLIAPLRRAGINIINGVENKRINVERVSEGDIVIIQRALLILEENGKYKEIIDRAHHEGRPVIFDLDDLLFYLPETHPDRPMSIYSPFLLPLFQTLIEADLVSVSTPKLRDELTKYNVNVKVLPNYFDDDLWHFSPSGLKKSSREMLTIGYMGTPSHQPDLEYITPVLLELNSQYPKSLRFHFWGTPPPQELRSLPQVQFTEWYSNSHKDFVEYFQTQAADIFIAPLEDNLFNRCKSPLKFFEYSALGVPGVYSRLNCYEEFVTDGHDGLLATSLDEWTDCLIRLIENDELRYHLADNAQNTIRKNWLLSQNAFRWEETYQSAFENQSSNRQQYDNIGGIINSINLQLTNTFVYNETRKRELSKKLEEQDQTVQKLANQLSQDRIKVEQTTTVEQSLSTQLYQARNEIDQLKAEVLRYALSKSWQITRPLRRMSRKLNKIFGVADA